MSRPNRPASWRWHQGFMLALVVSAPADVSRQVPRPGPCLAASATTILAAAAASDGEARAYWLSRNRLQWPSAPPDGRYALYRSRQGRLRARLGARVLGADARVPLSPNAQSLATPTEARFRHVGSGARLELPPDHRDLADLFRDQVFLVREDAEGRVLDVTRIQLPGALDDLYATATAAADLGPSIDATGVRLALWAPTARAVSVCLYPGRGHGPVRVVPATLDSATGIWRARGEGDLHGAEYLFLVEVFVPGVGVVRNRVSDPYSVALTADSRRSVLLALTDDRLKPPGWDVGRRPAPLAAMTDLAVYELHVRDFSITDTSVRRAWRGKYQAFSEPQSAGMRHLRALQAAGITDVHLLPVYDVSTIPEVGCVTPAIPLAAAGSERQQAAVSAVRDRDCFNWGYDPWHYTVPEGSYATDPNDPAVRIREFRAMVQALHAGGLRVGMDVVYNHTFASGQHPRSVLDRIVPGYYHRLDARGRVERSTCCENTATEHAMMGKLMVESAVTWVRHYRIDSFRFDLMGHQPREVMERLQRAVDRAAGQRVPLIGEGWDFGEVAGGARFVQASQQSLGGSGIATFSDRARDAIRGGGCCDGGEALVVNQGWLNGLHYAPNAPNVGRDRLADLVKAADLVRVGLAGTLKAYPLLGADGVVRPLSRFDYGGQPAGYADEPGEVVNYIENHDNLTLFDLNALRLPRSTSREQRARSQVLGIAVVALSQGIPYFHAGVEIMRSKSLDRDSYDSGDWFNRLDWSLGKNGFGSGLPPAHRNQRDWPVMRPALADSGIAPTPKEIRWTRDATLDWLRIRRSSALFRMRTAEDVRSRLHFRNVGPAQVPTMLVGHLDGTGYEGANFREALYFINAAGDDRTLALADEAGKRWVLHPVHRDPNAADVTAKAARVESPTGRFTIPARTGVVFVIE